MLRILFCLFPSLLIIQPSFAEPFWGSKVSRPANTPVEKLKPGQFIWKGDIVPAGPLVAEINLEKQRFSLYRNGVLIGVSTTSTGRRKGWTPTGVFSVLSRIRYHRSKKYNNAPMPYTHHIDNTGIAIHAGKLPGYPASHGCIRLPSAFAKLFFKLSYIGMPVVVRDEKTGAIPLKPPSLSSGERFRWQPEKEILGAVSMVLSKADQRLLVYRNGIEIGRAKLVLEGDDKTFASSAYLLHQGKGEEVNPFLNPDTANFWTKVDLPGKGKKQAHPLKNGVLQGLQISPEFAKAVSSVLTAGAGFYISDGSVLGHDMGGLASKALSDSQPRQAKKAAVILKNPVAKNTGKWPPAEALAEIEGMRSEMQDMQKQVEKMKQELNNIQKQL